jgi:hypothetical protein
MRILGLERRFVQLAACSVAFLFSEAAVASTTQVETYTAGGVVDFLMPGAPDGAGLTFSTNATVQTLDFTPGSVFFNGQGVDFDGREADFLANVYEGTLGFPVDSGPDVVTVGGPGLVSGSGGGGGGGGCYVTAGPIDVGPTFSSSNLDVAVGGGVDLRSVFPNWDSSDVAHLNGHMVTLDGAVSITSVDAVNGIVSFTTSGTIEAANAAVPALTYLGSLCLAIGLFGTAILAISRRGLRGRDPSA